MILCYSHRFIYIHPPKTAGTAVSLALGAVCSPQDAQIGDWPGAEYPTSGPLKGIGKHAPLAAIAPLQLGVDLADYRVILSVRNPWDRLVSFYHWARAQDFQHPQVLAAKEHDFAGFLALPRIQRSFGGAPYAAYAPKPDHVLRHECLAADMAALGQVLGLTLPLAARVNTSPRQADWRQYYSDETAALVARFCARDIADYGYRFDDAGTAG